jgi:protein O-GlcNAc transferase
MTTREKVLSDAFSALSSGQPQLAEKKLRSFLATNARDVDARYQYARCLAALGQMQAAIGEYQRVLARQPQHLYALIDMGVALTMLEQPGQALAVLDRAQALDTRRPETQFALGLCQLALQNWPVAESCLRRAQVLGLRRPEVYERLAAALLQMRRYSEAVDCLQEALRLYPNFAEALAGLGDARLGLGHATSAVAAYRQALALQPDDALLRAALGTALLLSDDAAGAAIELEQALALNPALPDAAVNLGAALSRLGQTARAAAAYERALAINPLHAAALLELAVLRADDGQTERAVELLRAAFEQRPNDLQVIQRIIEQARMLGQRALELEFYERALLTLPGQPAIHDGYGQVLHRLGRFHSAILHYQRALELDPQRRTTQLNRARAHESAGEVEAARGWFEQMLALDPADPAAMAGTISCALRLCDWSRVESVLVQLRAADAIDTLHPFVRFALDLAPQELAAGARRHAATVKAPAALVALDRRIDRSQARLKVAYLSPDFRQHPVAYALAGVVAHHDRDLVECIGVSLVSPDDSTLARELMDSFDEFIDASATGDRALIEQLRRLEIDVAIDLAGFTAGARPEVFASRIAPLQVNYLGFAGSTGATYMDYMVADPVVVPAGEEYLYSESVVRLPHCYLPFDARRPLAARVPRRADLGLPANGFVFCGFSNGYKISRAMFDVWLRLLQTVPGSVLWLRAGPAAMHLNLQQAALERGVSIDRLIFAEFVASNDEHLARLQCADVFLDTLPYNAHTTAAEALWAGVPVVSCRGRGFAGRVGASVLSAAGLSDLVCADLESYFQLTQRLAASPAALTSVRERLSQGRDSLPLFNTAGYVRDFEAVLRQLRVAGHAP